MRITKKLQREFVRLMLSTNKAWALRALVVIYEHQTDDEKSSEETHYENCVGFNKFDANFLTSLAESYLKCGRLTERQMVFVFKAIPKYWKQIIGLSDIERLNAQILKWKGWNKKNLN